MSNEIHPSKYPQARRDESIVEDHHGVKVADPYRWLEDPDAKETQEFVSELNKLSAPFIKESGILEKLNTRLTKLWDYEKFGSKTKHGGKFYIFHNTGLQNQSVWYQSDSYKEKGKVFFDVNKLSDDGTTALASHSWTEDGAFVAITLSDKGSDVSYAQFYDNTGKQLPDKIPNIKFSGVDWLPDNKGVIYSTYPGLKSSDKAENVLVKEEKNHTLYYHRMGTDVSEDIVINDFPDRPNASNSGWVTEDGSYLIVSSSESCGATNQVHYFDLKAAGNKINGRLDWKPLFTDEKSRYDFVDNVGQSEALIVTNRDASNCKLVRIKLDKPEDNWTVLLEHDEKRRLECIIPFAKDKFIACYLEDVHHVLQIHDRQTGKFIERIPVPIGSVSSIHTRRERSEVFFSFESILMPPAVYRFDYADKHETGQIKLELIHETAIEGYKPDDFETKQIFYKSKDGTQVPMFITAKKNIQMNNQNHTLLYGYGGFDVTLSPYFSASRIYWLNTGGVHVMANLRGGGEYGKKWHDSGKLDKKQNVFDDFQAAAEYLSQPNGYTKPEKLAIQGGSNGGLLVCACLLQRPELFGAVVGQVGVLDMLRFHKHTIGHAWTGDYGNPDKAEDFKFIYKYSPLHNIQVKQHQFPATLILTADHDDRVVPSHSLKFMAELYHVVARDAADTQKKPLLAYIDVNAGHGAGKPTTKVIFELAQIYSFYHRALNVPYNDE